MLCFMYSKMFSNRKWRAEKYVSDLYEVVREAFVCVGPAVNP